MAIANGVPKRVVRALPVGEGVAVLGCTLEPVISVESDGGEPHLCVVLTVVAGKESELVPTVPVKVIVAELSRTSVAELRAKVEAALKGPEEQAQ